MSKLHDYKKYVTANDGKETTEYICVDIASDDQTKDWSGEKLASERFIQVMLKRITGKVLTIVDASIPEGKQNKSVKDLVRKCFIDEFVETSEWLNDEKAIKEAVENIEDEDITPVSNEEILGA